MYIKLLICIAFVKVQFEVIHYLTFITMRFSYKKFEDFAIPSNKAEVGWIPVSSTYQADICLIFITNTYTMQSFTLHHTTYHTNALSIQAIQYHHHNHSHLLGTQFSYYMALIIIAYNAFWSNLEWYNVFQFWEFL